jgi:Protein of unknown function (DUF1569)
VNKRPLRKPLALQDLKTFWYFRNNSSGMDNRQIWGGVLGQVHHREVAMSNVAAVKNGTLLHPAARAEILRRIEALTPESERRWGRMTAHQMVCHLSDACRAALGERRVPVIGTLWERTVIRWLAIHTNVKWPQGVRTVPEADQEITGTRPTEFARDVDELRRLIQRFNGAEAQLSGHHPLFGALSAAEWGRFSYRHADHHLRQFGI